MTNMEIEKVIMDSLDDLNSNLDKPIDLSAKSETILFGKGSSLDSIDFVSLIIDIERQIRDISGKNITLADKRALSHKNSPFRTVGTLTNFVFEQLNEVKS